MWALQNSVTPQSLSSLQSITYSWYRDSASTNPSVQAPALGLVLSNGRTLVYEPVYNNSSGWTAPTDTWVTENITQSSEFWYTATGTFDTYSNWASNLSELTIVSIALYGGSGWNGNFKGAVDNPSWQFSNQDPAGPFNFEVQVPEPASLAALGLALAGAACVYRRRQQKA